MILDKIENQHLYTGLGTKFLKAFEFLNTTNLKEIAPGEYPIDGDQLLAIVMEYETTAKSENSFEGHQKYIDLQYVVTGTEQVGVVTRINQTPFEVHKEDDYDLYHSNQAAYFTLDKGMFMIFFPDDLHMPSVYDDQPSTVKKVVVKIAV